MLRFNIQMISSYPGASDIFLAINRGEIDARLLGLSAITSTKPEWLKPDSNMQALVQIGRTTRHALFPNVPLARDSTSMQRRWTATSFWQSSNGCSRFPPIFGSRCGSSRTRYRHPQGGPEYGPEGRSLSAAKIVGTLNLLREVPKNVSTPRDVPQVRSGATVITKPISHVSLSGTQDSITLTRRHITATRRRCNGKGRIVKSAALTAARRAIPEPPLRGAFDARGW